MDKKSNGIERSAKFGTVLSVCGGFTAESITLSKSPLVKQSKLKSISLTSEWQRRMRDKTSSNMYGVCQCC